MIKPKPKNNNDTIKKIKNKSKILNPLLTLTENSDVIKHAIRSFRRKLDHPSDVVVEAPWTITTLSSPYSSFVVAKKVHREVKRRESRNRERDSRAIKPAADEVDIKNPTLVVRKEEEKDDSFVDIQVDDLQQPNSRNFVQDENKDDRKTRHNTSKALVPYYHHDHPTILDGGEGKENDSLKFNDMTTAIQLQYQDITEITIDNHVEIPKAYREDKILTRNQRNEWTGEENPLGHFTSYDFFTRQQCNVSSRLSPSSSHIMAYSTVINDNTREMIGEQSLPFNEGVYNNSISLKHEISTSSSVNYMVSSTAIHNDIVKFEVIIDEPSLPFTGVNNNDVFSTPHQIPVAPYDDHNISSTTMKETATEQSLPLTNVKNNDIATTVNEIFPLSLEEMRHLHNTTTSTSQVHQDTRAHHLPLLLFTSTCLYLIIPFTLFTLVIVWIFPRNRCKEHQMDYVVDDDIESCLFPSSYSRQIKESHSSPVESPSPCPTESSSRSSSSTIPSTIDSLCYSHSPSMKRQPSFSSIATTTTTSPSEFHEISITVPSGPLGLVLDSTMEGPMIICIKPSSSIVNLVQSGDLIVEVDGIDTKFMKGSELTLLLIQRGRFRRHLVLSRWS